ncbi:unnamed protein product [Periconia digitata]|uniref:Uncharacterized protein n=1 Tax=Periconia digitata TaxID=1303443 RepID=A0A9W4XQS5_9PLEO|nr:unnamed protein product [Periconia digitata]
MHAPNSRCCRSWSLIKVPGALGMRRPLPDSSSPIPVLRGAPRQGREGSPAGPCSESGPTALDQLHAACFSAANRCSGPPLGSSSGRGPSVRSSPIPSLSLTPSPSLARPPAQPSPAQLASPDARHSVLTCCATPAALTAVCSSLSNGAMHVEQASRSQPANPPCRSLC